METVAALPSATKNLLQFTLGLLPQCGDSYLPVLKAIHGFSRGEPFLGFFDATFLRQQLKLSHIEEEEVEDGEDGGKEGEEKESKLSSLWTFRARMHGLSSFLVYFYLLKVKAS